MNPSLVVLAAGIGSRYGGLKQMDAFGPNGETIIDYSIYDALHVGFDKVVFVIRRELENDFKEVFVNKFGDKIEVKFVFQELTDVPAGFTVPSERKKPWGTGHAVMAAEKAVQEPFAVINADDFYGRGAFRTLYDFLARQSNDSRQYALVAYQLVKTLSEHGHVSRGVCQGDKHGFLVEIKERTKIFKQDEQIVYQDEDGQLKSLPEDALVSMNMMGFAPTLFHFLHEHFEKFLQQEGQNPKAEFFLPGVLDQLIRGGKIKVKILPTNEQWFGVTYKEDKEWVMNSIRQLIEQGVYPANLWGKP